MAINNPFYTAVDEVTPEYIPLPMDALFQAGQAIQNRANTSYEQMDATQTGLSSMVAYAPAHREYRNQISESYRKDASDLLDKYNNRASDPQFIREMRSLNRKYTTDPNIQTILQANELYKNKLKTIGDIEKDGGKYIDTNPNFTGIDSQGNLISDVGSVKRTTWEKDLSDAFKEAAKSRIGDGSYTSNRDALEATRDSFLQSIGTDPNMREALQYFIQQDYTPEQALMQVANTLDRLTESSNYLMKDDMNERLALQRANLAVSQGNLAISRERLSMDKAKHAVEMQEAMRSVLVPTLDPVETKGVNNNLIKSIQDVKKAFESKGNKNEYFIEYNQANQAKYPDAKVVTTSSPGVGGAGSTVLKITKDDYIKEQSGVINEARDVVDPTGTMTDLQVLNAYENLLKSDNNAPTYYNVIDPKVRKNLSELYGSDLRDTYLEDNKGKTRRTLDSKIDLSKVKNITYTGHTTSPVDKDGTLFPNGSVRLSGIDEKGNPITFYKPLSNNDPIASLNTVRNNISKALKSGISNTRLINNPEYGISIPTENGQSTVYPQKRSINGRVSIIYKEVDNKGNTLNIYDPSELENIELMQTNEYIKRLK